MFLLGKKKEIQNDKELHMNMYSLIKDKNSKFDSLNWVTAAGMSDSCLACLYDTQVTLCEANVILRIALKCTLGACELILLHLHSYC